MPFNTDENPFAIEVVKEKLSQESTFEGVVEFYLKSYSNYFPTEITPKDLIQHVTDQVNKVREFPFDLSRMEGIIDEHYMIEDGYFGGRVQFVRVFPNDVVYLWLVFEEEVQEDEFIEQPRTSKLVGVIISEDDIQPDGTPIEGMGECAILFEKYEGTELTFKPRVFISFENTCCTNVQLKINDEEECGYYFSF